jgi:hypothetical protein
MMANRRHGVESAMKRAGKSGIFFKEIITSKLMVSDNILSRNLANLLPFRMKYAEKGRVKGSNIKKSRYERRT